MMESLDDEKENCDGTHCHKLAMRVGFAVIVDQLNSIIKTVTTMQEEAKKAYEEEAGKPYKELKKGG